MRSSRQKTKGFTLMEVVIAMAIAGVLAAIAIPSYRDYVLRNDRAVAKRILTELVAQQESRFLRQRSYAVDFVDLVNIASGDPTEVFIDKQGQFRTAVADEGVIYQLNIEDATADAFRLTATAVNAQARDADCPELELRSTGQRLPNGNDCWER